MALTGTLGILAARQAMSVDVLEQDHARRDDTHEDFTSPPR